MNSTMIRCQAQFKENENEREREKTERKQSWMEKNLDMHKMPVVNMKSILAKQTYLYVLCSNQNKTFESCWNAFNLSHLKTYLFNGQLCCQTVKINFDPKCYLGFP